MSEDIVERIDKLPKDGKHFTVEEMMSEKLKELAEKKPDNDGDLVFNTLTSTAHTHSSPNLFTMLEPSYVTTAADRGAIYDTRVGGIKFNAPPQYELDMDQIQSIEDIKTILAKMNITFTGRDAVKGLEHLVKRK